MIAPGLEVSACTSSTHWRIASPTAAGQHSCFELLRCPIRRERRSYGFLLKHQLRSNALLFAAVSTLKVGETSEILELSLTDSSTPPGYMLVKLISREGTGQRDLTSPVVQQNVRNQIRNDRSQLLETAYLEILRDNAKVVNFFAEEFRKKPPVI